MSRVYKIIWRCCWQVLYWKFDRGKNEKTWIWWIHNSVYWWYSVSVQFLDFLRNGISKNHLIRFLANGLLVLHSDGCSLKFFVTLNDTILTNVNHLLFQNDINYCTAEEADPSLIQYGINQRANALEYITIQIVDSIVIWRIDTGRR